MININESAIPEGYRRVDGTIKEGILYKVLDVEDRNYVQAKLIKIEKDKDTYAYTLRIRGYKLRLHVQFDAPYFDTIPENFDSLWVRTGIKEDEIVVIKTEETLIGVIENKGIDANGIPKSTFSLSNGKEVKMYRKRNIEDYRRYHDEYQENKRKEEIREGNKGFISGNIINAMGMNPELVRDKKYDDEESKAYALESYKSSCTLVTDNVSTARYLDGKGFSVKLLEEEVRDKDCIHCGSRATTEYAGCIICKDCGSKIDIKTDKAIRIAQRGGQDICGI